MWRGHRALPMERNVAGEHFYMKRECTASERRRVTECYSPPSARRRSAVEDRRHLVEQHVAHFGERLLGRARWRGLPGGIEFNRVRLAKAAMAHLAESLLEQCETLRACVARQAVEKLIDHDGRELAARRLGGGLVIVHASECGEPAGRCQ